MYEISQNLAVSFDQLQSVCEVYRIVQVFCFIAIRPFHDRLLFDWAQCELTCVYVKQIYRVYTGKTFDHNLLLGVNDKFTSGQIFLDRIQLLFKIQLLT